MVCLVQYYEKLQKAGAQARTLEKAHRNICVEPYSILKQFLTQELPIQFCIKQTLTSTVSMPVST